MQPSSWGFRAMETPTWSGPPHNTERLSRVQLATSLTATVLSTTNFSRGAWYLCYFQLHLVALYYHKLTRCNCIRRSWSQPEFEFQTSQLLARWWSSHELPVWWPHSIGIGQKKQGHLDLGPTAFSFCNKEMLIRATTYIQKMQKFYGYDSWHNADMTTCKLCSSVLHEPVHGWAISSCAQCVTLQKYFSHPSVVIYFFSNLTHKTETGTANRWETTNSNPPGQSGNNNQIIFVPLFNGRCHSVLCLLPASANSGKLLSQKPFC
jgi:hypothetical protein